MPARDVFPLFSGWCSVSPWLVSWYSMHWLTKWVLIKHAECHLWLFPLGMTSNQQQSQSFVHFFCSVDAHGITTSKPSLQFTADNWIVRTVCACVNCRRFINILFVQLLSVVSLCVESLYWSDAGWKRFLKAISVCLWVSSKINIFTSNRGLHFADWGSDFASLIFPRLFLLIFIYFSLYFLFLSLFHFVLFLLTNWRPFRIHLTAIHKVPARGQQ